MRLKGIKWSRWTDCLPGKQGIVLFFLPCILLFGYFINSRNDFEYRGFQYPSLNISNINGTSDFLVWNPKCHMLSISPMDPSIIKFVKREKFESCWKGQLWTRVSRDSNGSAVLLFDEELAKARGGKNLICTWTPIYRPIPSDPPSQKCDSMITLKESFSLEKQVILPKDVELLLVSCKANKKKGKPRISTVYENVHPIIQLDKVRDRLERNDSMENATRKLSVLVFGIDSVSRLNFLRNMPLTEKHLRQTGWINLKGYNKMADNTFPNLMAILTGQNLQQSYSKCIPTKPYKLDKCQFAWKNFREAGYVTAYGEDDVTLSTFNYLKVGFVEPPTDYYLRPYVLASDKLLKSKERFGSKYCTGPELTFDRIFDYGMEFAKTFIGNPYFGFFWINSVSHDDMNGPSSVDERVLEKFKYLNETGVMNDTMIIFLSDHGMRYGAIRNTFVGWYEERLPFIYIWLPYWFRKEHPEKFESIRLNENRLSSPYDLFETLRDIVINSGGIFNDSSAGCSTCQSLFTPITEERGCKEAGVSPHWCTCRAFQQQDINDEIVQEGARKFLQHIDDIVKDFKDKRGKRLCAKFKLKTIHRADRVIDLDDAEAMKDPSIVRYFYFIQVSPGNGKFEVTIQYNGNGNYSIFNDQISRIDSYGFNAKCLNQGSKPFCHCVK